ncbi:MAG: VOC family protein [Propioniciclava sp.]|uniref:VOC family protein n=1 Tax=Propioniciclava sp. TaxID=2038686 RepID=UPI0039E41FC5
MQRIVPTIWFDHNAAEAAAFYASAFRDARVIETQHYPAEGLLDFQAEMAGEVLTVVFEIGGYRMMGINAGPEFRPNPSVSFFVNFDPSVDPDARAHLDELWAKLGDGGQALMPLQDYPHSPRYGWIEDRYGVSWQLMLTNPDGDPRPFIIPSIMFGHTVQGRAKEAIDFYTSVFDGRPGVFVPYPPQMGPVAGQVMFADFQLLGQWFTTMDAAGQDFTFTCGVSLMVECHGQDELDHYWSRLSAVPEAEACGWCADKFGLSWQLVPADLGELMAKPDSYAKLMGMKKIDIAAFG